MATNDWVEAGSSSDSETWKPEAVGDTLQGTYTSLKTNVGMNNSNIYMVTTKTEGKEDQLWSVWGSAVLDTKFEAIPVGSLVKVEFLGLEKGKGPKPYKNFKVLYKPNAVADVFPGSEVVG